MSVSFAQAVAEGLVHNGVPVKWWPGWDTRGNGQTSAYEGLIWHHTATGSSNEPPAVLITGRPDLTGPLCNSAGNADGSITIIAAHPANHAGASGGPATAPLPVTTLFNRRVWGHEIVYPGTSPMSPAQYRAALILAGVISGILGRPNANWARGHAETSVTGKWDPGCAPSKTMDLDAMRAGVWPALWTEESDLPLSDEDIAKIAERVWRYTIPNRFNPPQPTQALDMLAWADLRTYNIDARTTNIEREVATRIPNRAGPSGTEDKSVKSDSMLGYAATAAGILSRMEKALEAGDSPRGVAALDDESFSKLAQIVCDEHDRRQRVRLNTDANAMGKG